MPQSRRSPPDGNFSAPRVVDGWTLGKQLGKGGNGVVYQATKDGAVGAFKQLSMKNASKPNRVARFKDEIAAMIRCKDIPGVLPVLDSCTDDSAGRRSYFVMAKAQTLSDTFQRGAPLNEVVAAVGSIARTLSRMHERGISHRDVKPDNLFRFNGIWMVGDFGLADFEGKLYQTQKGERIGPTFFIAPEMLNDAEASNGAAADVFSLAKVLWVLATGAGFPLPGSYDVGHPAFWIGSYNSEGGTVSLDRLIASATRMDPLKRITMGEFAQELESWLMPKTEDAGEKIQLDVGEYAAKLERQRQQAEHARAEEKNASSWAEETGRRLREKFRPLANEIRDAFIQSNFDSVYANVDNFNWGFEVTATIGVDGTNLTRIHVRLHIEPNENYRVRILGRFLLERPGSQATLWTMPLVALFAAGPNEEIRVSQAIDGVRRALPPSVKAALSSAFPPQGAPVNGPTFRIKVLDLSGNGLEGADVRYVHPSGAYFESVSGETGMATVGQLNLSGNATVMIAHPSFEASVVMQGAADLEVLLRRVDKSGSYFRDTGWDVVPGLNGLMLLTKREHLQVDAFADGLEPVNPMPLPISLAVGVSLELKDAVSDKRVVITPRAIIGQTILFDRAFW